MRNDDNPLGGITYARFFPSDWRSGCFTLNLEEEGLYIRSCAWMYDTGQPIPGNDAVAAKLLHVQVQKYSKVMQSLIDKGKMIRAQGVVMNKRVFDEIDKIRQVQAGRSIAAKRREADRQKRLETAATEVIMAARAAAKTPQPPPLPGGGAVGEPPHLPPHLPGGGCLGGPTPPPTPPPTPGQSKKPNEINECGPQEKHEKSRLCPDAGKAISIKKEEEEKKEEESAQPSTVEQEAGPRKAGRLLREKDGLGMSYDALQDKLLGAANGAMADPAIAPGLANLQIPIMWLEHGADLERDVLPTIAEVAGRMKNQQTRRRISNWNYFTNAVAEAKARREAGLPSVSVVTSGVVGDVRETQAQRISRLAEQLEAKNSPRNRNEEI